MKYNTPWVWAGAMGLITLIVAYYFGSRTGKATTQTAAADQLAKEIDKTSLSFDLSQYETFAQKIHVAFCEVFTDEEAIYSVLTKLRTKDDVLQLIKTFGTRDLVFGIDNYTLPQWFAYSFNTAKIEKVNDILKRNSIEYSF